MEVKHVVMHTPRLSIRGRNLEPDDPSLQDALAAIHETPERPRCLCVPGGVEMYVAFHRRYLAKRMPDTGSLHHPAARPSSRRRGSRGSVSWSGTRGRVGRSRTAGRFRLSRRPVVRPGGGEAPRATRCRGGA